MNRRAAISSFVRCSARHEATSTSRFVSPIGFAFVDALARARKVLHTEITQLLQHHQLARHALPARRGSRTNAEGPLPRRCRRARRLPRTGSRDLPRYSAASGELAVEVPAIGLADPPCARTECPFTAPQLHRRARRASRRRPRCPSGRAPDEPTSHPSSRSPRPGTRPRHNDKLTQRVDPLDRPSRLALAGEVVEQLRAPPARPRLDGDTSEHGEWLQEERIGSDRSRASQRLRRLDRFVETRRRRTSESAATSRKKRSDGLEPEARRDLECVSRESRSAARGSLTARSVGSPSRIMRDAGAPRPGPRRERRRNAVVQTGRGPPRSLEAELESAPSAHHDLDASPPRRLTRSASSEARDGPRRRTAVVLLASGSSHTKVAWARAKRSGVSPEPLST